MSVLSRESVEKAASGMLQNPGAMPMQDPIKLRELAAWYREFAEKTGNPSIWEARLRMAEDLEREADRLEQRQAMVLEAS